MLTLAEALGAAVVAPGRDRRPRRAATAARSQPGRPANLCVIDPARHVGRRRRRGSRAGPATRRAPAGSSPARSATPSAAASPSSSTARPRDDAGTITSTAGDSLRRSPTATDVRGRRDRRDRRPDDRRRSRPARSCSTPRSSGYQEIVTDPSYAGQIITFTYPHIGNYGVNADDDESASPVLPRRDRARPRRAGRSNWRADRRPRRLPRAPRRARASPASTPAASPATSATPARCPARSAPPSATRCSRPRRPTAAPTASTSSPRSPPTEPYTVGADDAPFYVVAYDFGIKRSILASSSRAGCQVEVVPASTPAADVLAREPDGVFLSNGPGDPAAVADAADNVARAARQGAGVRHLPRAPDHRPRARRATRSSCAFGHHGGNHPVRHLPTGRVEITSQNHNYAVDADSLPERRRASPTSTSTTATSKACASLDAPRVQRAVPPRGRARPARRRATCSTSSPT